MTLNLQSDLKAFSAQWQRNIFSLVFYATRHVFQVWHEATENTISRLAANSADVASSLEQSSELAQEMIARQNVTLKNQEELLRHERLLRENMHQSVLDVQRSHEETKNVIREQRVLFLEVFDRVASMVAFHLFGVFGRLSWLFVYLSFNGQSKCCPGV